MASTPEAAGGIYRAVQPKDVIAPPKPERRRRRVKEPKPPRRPGRIRRIFGRTALALGLAGATLFTGKTIYDNYITDEPGQNPNPTPTLTDGPNPSPTITEPPPTDPVSPNPPETPTEIVQPICESYNWWGNEHPPYGYLTRGESTFVSTDSVLMCGKVVDIVENSHFEFEEGNETFTKIRLYLGLDRNGEDLFGDFVLDPDHPDATVFIARLYPKDIPSLGNGGGGVSIDQALSEISLGEEIVVELPVENFHDFDSDPESWNSDINFRFNRFAANHHYGYNRTVVNMTPLGDERVTKTNYPVGHIKTLYLHK